MLASPSYNQDIFYRFSALHKPYFWLAHVLQGTLHCHMQFYFFLSCGYTKHKVDLPISKNSFKKTVSYEKY